MRSSLPAAFTALACAAASAAFSSGCDVGLGDDPFSNLGDDPCLPGHERSGDSACVLAYRNIAIDGRTIDWAGVDTIALPTECDGCDRPLVEGLQAALFFDDGVADQLVLRATLQGRAPPPVDDDQLRYILEFRSLDEHPSNAVHALILSGRSAAYRVNDQYVVPAFGRREAYAFAHTLDGFEVSVPVQLLPFPSGTAITASVAKGSAADLRLFPVEPPVVRACWDIFDFEQDPCAPRRGR